MGQGVNPAPQESDNLNRGQIVAGLGFRVLELELNAAGLVEISGGRLDVAIILGGPGLTQLGKERPAVVVMIRVLLEEQDGEGLLLALVGDRCEVERDDGHRLANEVLGLELLTAGHERGEGELVLSDLLEVNHDIYLLF